MISRTFASIFPRQSASDLILASINAEADSTGTFFFMDSSNSRTYFSCTRLRPPQCVPDHVIRHRRRRPQLAHPRRVLSAVMLTVGQGLEQQHPGGRFKWTI